MEETFRCYMGLGCQRLVVRMGVWLKEIVIKLKRKKKKKDRNKIGKEKKIILNKKKTDVEFLAI